MKLTWVCRRCREKYDLIIEPVTLTYVRAGHRVAFRCDCGEPYILAQKGIYSVYIETQCGFFRYLLKGIDVVDDIGFWQRIRYDG